MQTMSNNTLPIVWSVAGSDSSGGAGMQADLLTMSDLNVHVCSIISAITAQNSVAVQHVSAVDQDCFAKQLTALASDMPPKVIKISLLASQEQIKQLVAIINALKHEHHDLLVVYDPVILASANQQQLTPSALLPDIIEYLMPLIDVMTPNLDELAVFRSLLLADHVEPLDTIKAIKPVAQQLLLIGCKHVVVKGGHLPNDAVTDYWISHQQVVAFQQPRIQTPHGHGTGCVFASAIASFLAQRYTIEDAIVLANSYLHNALVKAQQQNYQLGVGADPLKPVGWPKQLRYFAQITQLDNQHLSPVITTPTSSFKPCDRHLLGLYPVVDSVEWLQFCLAKGVKTVQLRLKDKPLACIEPAIKQAVTLGETYKAQVFINDYWQLAIKHRAFGVHLGQEDIQQADLKQIAEAGLRLGISTHGYFELIQAIQLKPSYIALGHIFSTQTKQMPSKPQGLKRLTDSVSLVKQAHDIPTVAIGGIKLQNAADVLKTGVDSIAVVTAITQSAEPDKTIEHFNRLLLNHLVPNNYQECTV